MKNKLITTTLSLALIMGSLNAFEVNQEDLKSSSLLEDGYLRVYGLGLQVGYPNSDLKDESYSGAGIQFENDFLNLIYEYGSNYIMASGVSKYEINSKYYVKGGLGYLKKQMVILGADKDVTQTTLGASFGYGDAKMYNIEAGYIDSKLQDAANADGHSKTSYIELVGKRTFAQYATFDIVGLYKNTNVFDVNYADYKAELGWYPLDSIRTFVSRTSDYYDRNDFSIRGGLQYTFATSKLSPYIKASKNTSTNMAVGIEYYDGISNKSLKMRDFFEYTVSTVDVVAQVIAPETFASKATKKPSVSGSLDTEAPTLTAGGTSTTVALAGSSVWPTSVAYWANDNVSSLANLTINVTTPNADVTVSQSADTITFTNTGAIGDKTLGFTFTDEAGNTSLEFTLTIQNFGG